MRNILTPLIAATALVAVGCATTGQGPFASPNEPHGVVRTDVLQSAKQTFTVDVVAIDGDLVSTADRHAIWLEPGEHTLTVRSKVDLSDTFGIKRSIGYSEAPNQLTLTVEAGKVYYIGMKAIRGERQDWQPVVWKVAES